MKEEEEREREKEREREIEIEHGKKRYLHDLVLYVRKFVQKPKQNARK